MANLIIKPTSGGSLVLQDEGGDAAVTVGTTGTTTFSSPPTLTNDNITGQHAFSIYHNGANQTLGTASAWTKWENNTADLDPKSGHGSHGYEVKTGGAGYWFIIGQMQFGGTLDSTQWIAVALYKNSTSMSDQWFGPQWDGSDNIGTSIHCVLNLAVGDYIYMYANHNGNTATVVQNGTDRNTVLSGFKLTV